MSSGAHALRWADWGTAAFARALADPCPVVLLVETRWSAPCADLRARVLADERVASVLATRVALVVVDADERPDIAERYTADGWPTLLALTPHGWPLAQLPCREPQACADALAGVVGQFAARREALMRHVPADPPPQARPEGPIDATAILAGWLDGWEGEEGGRRAAATPRALEAAIDRASREGHHDLVDRAVAVIDGLADSALRDASSGLWFRAAPGAPGGWEPVQTLDDQAAWVAAEAAALVARPSDDRAARLTRLVRAIDGAFGARHGYRAARFIVGAADAATRRDFGDMCQHDDRHFVETQARMAAALMRAGGAGRMGTWTSRAVDRLDELVSVAYRRDGGVAHVLDEGGARIRGLLGDQVSVTAALLDAWEVSGRSAYLDAADELLQSTLRKFADPASALLRDRVPTTAGAGDVGLLGRVLHPPDANATAATCLARIALVRDDAARAAAARDLLGACLATADPADPTHPALLAALA